MSTLYNVILTALFDFRVRQTVGFTSAQQGRNASEHTPDTSAFSWVSSWASQQYNIITIVLIICLYLLCRKNNPTVIVTFLINQLMVMNRYSSSVAPSNSVLIVKVNNPKFQFPQCNFHFLLKMISIELNLLQYCRNTDRVCRLNMVGIPGWFSFVSRYTMLINVVCLHL